MMPAQTPIQGISEVNPVNHKLTTIASARHIYFGLGAHQQLGQYCAEIGISNVLMLVTDPGIVSLGLHLPVLQVLQQNGFEVVLFSEVQADPHEQIVLEATRLAVKNQITGVIGFGGGSSLDVAKMVALLGHVKSRDKLPDCYGVNNVIGSRLPLIQIPTTAGTGSEVTPVAIITTGEAMKNACVSSVLIADSVVLDATFIEKLPPHITAATGIDAMVHALEAYTSAIKKNPVSDALATQALKLLSTNILKVAGAQGSKNINTDEIWQARENMLLGSMLAGQAFANAPVGAVHALAYPLGGHFHIPHGNSNALVLLEVMKFNLPEAAVEYAQIADVLLLGERNNSEEQKAQALIQHFATLLDTLNLPLRLRDYGVTVDDLDKLADDAMKQTRLLQNNPREVIREDALAIYQRLL